MGPRLAAAVLAVVFSCFSCSTAIFPVPPRQSTVQKAVMAATASKAEAASATAIPSVLKLLVPLRPAPRARTRDDPHSPHTHPSSLDHHTVLPLRPAQAAAEFAAGLDGCCPELEGKTAAELLQLYTEQVAVTEVAHGFFAVRTNRTFNRLVGQRRRRRRLAHSRRRPNS